MKYAIGRPVNGISINGLEYVVDEKMNRLLFDSEEKALSLLREYGYDDERIEAEGVVIKEVEA